MQTGVGHIAKPDYQKNCTKHQNMVFPEEYKLTKEGEPSLLSDSRPSKKRIVISSTARNLRLLASSEHYFECGTFKSVPHLFHQLYALHHIQVNISIQFLYALQPDWTKTIWEVIKTSKTASTRCLSKNNYDRLHTCWLVVFVKNYIEFLAVLFWRIQTESLPSR